MKTPLLLIFVIGVNLISIAFGASVSGALTYLYSTDLFDFWSSVAVLSKPAPLPEYLLANPFIESVVFLPFAGFFTFSAIACLTIAHLVERWFGLEEAPK
ncbi:hypothetical protein LH464_22935 [Neorhizobium sp. T786]|uniref:hypothetical protein n=1 Tax=Pseudorhizobium xiangyangii TaxID=2883104 RepID=UPI001CFF9B15|nr:hypothetical protein [Neorhizobium xiangyangii]MCB5205321.1 hypothetical protein [Neorhizobium xiangyangii]